MIQNTFTKKALLSLLKISFAFSLLITFVITLITFIYESESRKNYYNNIILSSLNDLQIQSFKDSPDKVLKYLQSKTGLMEIATYDGKCKLMSFSTLSFAERFCPSKGERLDSTISSEDITVIYKIDKNLLSMIFSNYKELLTILVVIFLLTTFCLILFLREAIIKPIVAVEQRLVSKDDTSRTFGVDLFFDKIGQLADSIVKHEKEKSKFELAKKVVHDIRNPLTFIKLHLSNKSHDLSTIAVKVEEISFHIDSLISSNKDAPLDISFREFLVVAANEMEYMFNFKVKVDFQIQDAHFKPKIHKFELNNILMNLARNSKEASATELSIRVRNIQKECVIDFSDNGIGIQPQHLDTLFHKNFTTKKVGNGIGLASIRENLLEIGGNINLNKDPNAGASFTIVLPVQGGFSQIVFIDDDKYLRSEWISYGEKVGVKVLGFRSVRDFMADSETIEVETPVYIDSELGDVNKGEVLAEEIYLKGFKKIFLTTSYSEVDISKFPWIDSVKSKMPNFSC